MVLRDLKILKEVGHNVFLYCLKNSILDERARELGIDCFYHNTKEKLTFFRWFKLGALKDIIERMDINIVHCYELQYLWPLAYMLRKRNSTALFFTVGHDIKKFYKQFWYRSLISRVDQVYLPVKEMNEEILGHFVVPRRKLFFSGLGLDHENLVNNKVIFDESILNLSCYVNEDEIEIDDISTCIEALWSLNEKRSLDKIAKLHIFASKKWDESVLKPQLDEKIASYKQQNNVIFHDNITVNCIKADIWISYLSNLPLEDYTLIALLKGIPVVTPRNATSGELSRVYSAVAQTYKSGDSRELRSRIEYCAKNLNKLQEMTRLVREPILDEHGIITYRQNILMNYQKHLNKRYRFFQA